MTPAILGKAEEQDAESLGPLKGKLLRSASVIDNSHFVEHAVTIKKAEQLTGQKQWRIRKEIKDGRLNVYFFGTKRMLVYVSEIDALIKSSAR